MSISKEDYEEPRCLLRMDKGKPGPLRTVPVGRVLEKLDEHLVRDDWAAAERHLDYWLAEAKDAHDEKAELAIQGERMGLFRKRGRREEALAAVREAIRLIESLGMEETVSGATAFVNIATVYKTFGESDKALPFFRQALPVYEAQLSEDDARLGGLCNNMALALTDLSQFAEARRFYEKALAVMARVPAGELEAAVTYLNLADLETAEKGPEEAEETVQDLLDKGRAALDAPDIPHNGYYAFVCRACAPTFEYYGRFMDAEELRERAEKIYKG